MRHLHIFWLLLFLQTAREAFCQINTHQHAFQPFRNEASMNEDMQQQTSRTRKVAIIGAGAGGTSAAYFLSKAQDRLENLGMSSESIDVTIFERDERIGGRTTVIHPYHDERLPAIELGASIFADVNKNLKRAAKQFGLSTGAKIGLGAPGVWDGQQFVIENLGDGWWNSAKLFWRYGYSPLTTQKLVRSLVDKFVQLYNPSFMHKQSNQSNQTESGFPWDTVKKMARSLSLDSLAGINAGDHFYQSGVSKLFVEEIIEAATLVNYGQEIYSIHGVGGSVSLAASGAAGVDGGNFRIFEKLLSSCRALRLRLGVHGEVTGLARFQTARSAVKAGKLSEQEAIEQGFLQHDDPSQLTEAGLTTKWWLGTKSGFGSLYDVVFLAAPWHSSGITLLNTEATIPSVSYVRLHVTIVVTTAPQPNPAYFGRGEKDSVPTSILTSHVALRKSDEKPKNSKNSSVWTSWPWGNDTKHGPLLEFNSLSYLQKMERASSPAREEYVVKLFSPKRLSDERLDAIFGQDKVLWTYRKEWDAYPYLSPTHQFAPIEVDDNLYFPNALESLISTMETATVSARNSVALYLAKEFGPSFVHGGTDCPWEEEMDDNEADWAAWGCRSA